MTGNFDVAFRQAAAIAGIVSDEETKAVKLALSTTPESHPRAWQRLESRAKRLYKRQTGIAIKAGFDWATIKQWLADHWLQIVGILVSIILMFL